MSSHFNTVRNVVSGAIPYILPTIGSRLAKAAAPMAVHELNHWAKKAGIDYRIVSTITKHRRELQKIREENMYYTPDELRMIYERQQRARQAATAQFTPRQYMPQTPVYPPPVPAPSVHTPGAPHIVPGTMYRQFQDSPPMTKEMREMMELRATRAKGRQYNINTSQTMPGPPPSLAPTGKETAVPETIPPPVNPDVTIVSPEETERKDTIGEYEIIDDKPSTVIQQMQQDLFDSFKEKHGYNIQESSYDSDQVKGKRGKKYWKKYWYKHGDKKLRTKGKKQKEETYEDEPDIELHRAPEIYEDEPDIVLSSVPSAPPAPPPPLPSIGPIQPSADPYLSLPSVPIRSRRGTAIEKAPNPRYAHLPPRTAKEIAEGITDDTRLRRWEAAHPGERSKRLQRELEERRKEEFWDPKDVRMTSGPKTLKEITALMKKGHVNPNTLG